MEFFRSLFDFIMPVGVLRMLKYTATRISLALDSILKTSLTSSISGQSSMARKVPLEPPEYGAKPANFLVQPGSGESTFMYDDSLPDLPVPELEQTLNKYLDSVKPFLTEAECRRTESVVNEFGNGVGKRLHKKLLNRAAEKRNWLDEWWLNEAYLRVRVPIAPFCNPAEIGICMEQYWPPTSGTQLERCALHLYLSVKIWHHVRREEIAPEGRGPIKVTMNQIRNVLHSIQNPGEHIDELQLHFKTEREGPCYDHVIVICNGHLIAMHFIDEKGRSHTPPEFVKALMEIKRKCEKKGPGLGSMTALPRTDWWKLRTHLASLHRDNREYLEMINTALGVYCLDSDDSAYTNVETFCLAVCGDPTNRWFDKCMNYIVAPNGVITTTTIHASADGMAMLTVNRLLQLYVYQCKGKWDGDETVRQKPRLKMLDFHVDDTILQGVEQGKAVFELSSSNLSVFVPTFHLFGKDLLKTFRIHPDTFVQLSLQLAYYKLHGRPASTYETATTRQFYRGRTETLRSCTSEALSWCKTMVDRRQTSKEKYEALKTARDKHDRLMREACSGQGCDRHLMGLRLIAAESGIADPEIYNDPAWKKSGGDASFVLSTSLSGYSPALGGMPPMVEDGYGCFYRIHDAKITFVVTSYKSCQETSERDLYGHLQSSFLEIRDIIAENQRPYAKL